MILVSGDMKQTIRQSKNISHRISSWIVWIVICTTILSSCTCKTTQRWYIRALKINIMGRESQLVANSVAYKIKSLMLIVEVMNSYNTIETMKL